MNRFESHILGCSFLLLASILGPGIYPGSGSAQDDLDPIYSARESFYTLRIVQLVAVDEAESTAEYMRQRGYPCYWVGERQPRYFVRNNPVLMLGLYGDFETAKRMKDYFWQRNDTEPEIQQASFETTWSHSIPAVTRVDRLLEVGHNAPCYVFRPKSGNGVGLHFAPTDSSSGRWLWWDQDSKSRVVLEDVGSASISSDSSLIFLKVSGATKAYRLDPWKETASVEEPPPSAVELESVDTVRELAPSGDWLLIEMERGVFLRRRGDLIIAPGKLVTAFGEGDQVVIYNAPGLDTGGVFLYTLEYYRFKRTIHTQD